jgi:Peptidase A4 family
VQPAGRRPSRPLIAVALAAVAFCVPALTACSAGHAAGSRAPKLVDTQDFGMTSTWSGYLAQRHRGEPAFTAVNGQWRVPAVTCPPAGQRRDGVAVWVGLGGGTSADNLYQIGTSSDCNNGRAVYYAWWEVWPVINPARPLLLVAAGDEMVADVHVHGATAYIDVTDVGPAGQGKWVEGESYPLRSMPRSAECIVENPNSGVTDMPWFGSVRFVVLRPAQTRRSSCTAEGAGDSTRWVLSSGQPAPWPIEQLGMTNGDGDALTFVSDAARNTPMTVTEAPNCRTAMNTCS